MTDYLWDKEECDQQREDTINYKKTKDRFFYPRNRAKRERDRRKKVRTSTFIFYRFFFLIKQLFITFTGIKSKFKC